MKKRRIILLSFGAVLLGAVVVVLWPKEKEPEYNGKPLSHWLNLYHSFIHSVAQTSASDMESASDAIRHIGTNALPFLVKRIAEETPNWRRKLGRFVQFNRAGQVRGFAWWPTQRTLLIEDSRGEAAVLGFQMLGEAASPAVPELARLMYSRSQSVSDHAMQALMMIGADGFKPLLAALTNHASQVRSRAAFYLPFTGTNVAFAVKTLVGCMEDTNNPPELRWSSIAALGILGEQKDIARDAEPAITRALSDANADVRSAATNALRQIAQGVVSGDQTAVKQ